MYFTAVFLSHSRHPGGAYHRYVGAEASHRTPARTIPERSELVSHHQRVAYGRKEPRTLLISDAPTRARRDSKISTLAGRHVPLLRLLAQRSPALWRRPAVIRSNGTGQTYLRPTSSRPYRSSAVVRGESNGG